MPMPDIPPPVIRPSPRMETVWLSNTPIGDVMLVLMPSTEIVAVVAATSKTVHGEGEHGAVNSEMELVSAVSVIVKAELVNDVVPTLPVAKP